MHDLAEFDRELNGASPTGGRRFSRQVYCRIADLFDCTIHGPFHGIIHTTVTGMAAVVGAGRRMGLTPDQMVPAVGITVGGHTATRQGRSDALPNAALIDITLPQA